MELKVDNAPEMLALREQLKHSEGMLSEDQACQLEALQQGNLKVTFRSYNSASRLSAQATSQREHRMMCILANVVGSNDRMSDKFYVWN